MIEIIYILMTLAFAFIDPFTLLPSLIIGWFISDRTAAVLLSGSVAIVMSIIIYQAMIKIGDTDINILPFFIRFLVAMAISFIAYECREKLKRRKRKKMI